MPNWNVLLHLLTLALLSVGGFLLLLAKTSIQTAAEEGAKLAIRNADWPGEFARELQKGRGLERQELRFKSYGALWKELRPLAVYDVARIDRDSTRALFKKLSDWYFSECGGLLLTPQSREFYFALQDLLRLTSSADEDWKADRSEELESDIGDQFRNILLAREASEAIGVFDYFKKGGLEDWEERGISLGKQWRTTTTLKLGPVWPKLTERERFAILQQVGSKLRSSLAADLESRER
jgi:hypothetical protein